MTRQELEEKYSSQKLTLCRVYLTPFLQFDIWKNKDKKTFDIAIRTRTSDLLGEITWHGPWRKYTFNTIEDCLFDTNCLKDIILFIDNLMQERKESK